MSVKIFTSAIAKGGSAKTTTAVHLAAFAAQHGLRTLLVDFDHQGQAAKALGMDSYPGVFDYLIADDPAIDVVRRTRFVGLDLLGSNQRTKRVEHVAYAERWRMERPRMAALFNGYDVVVIDTHPSGWLHEYAIALAHTTIIPVALDFMAADKVALTVETVKALAGAVDFRILPVMDDRTVESRTNRQALTDAYGAHVLPSIPRRTAMREAPGYGLTIYEHDPHNDAATAYAAVARIVLGIEEAAQ